VVRGVLLPATMKLLGERNWYLPSWLAWLPRASLEGETLEGGIADAPAMRPDPQPALASAAD
jgi:RND superfamily putative drug exporter